MLNKTVVDSFKAYLTENAKFTSVEEYPIIRSEMIAKNLPRKIMPFSKAITFQGNLSNTFICTYSPDKTFERVRQNPKRYLSFFKRTAGIIGFDFSIHTDMPLILQKAQINDNLSLTYYYGQNGVPIIPNLRCGIDELMPEFFEAIPKRTKVAIGTHGFIKEKSQKHEWDHFINCVITDLEPTNIIVYGALNGQMFDDFKSKTNIMSYDSWISDRWKEVNTNVY